MLSRLLARVGLVTPEQRAWAWYDCGNSAYFTTVITAVFPAFFASYAAGRMPAGEATTRFGVITTVRSRPSWRWPRRCWAPWRLHRPAQAAARRLLLARHRRPAPRWSPSREGGWRSRRALRPRQHRRVGIAGVLRLDAAERRAAERPTASRRPATRWATSAAACCWSEPRVDAAAADFGLRRHGGGHQAVVRQRRRVVAALHDPAAAATCPSPRASSAAARRAAGVADARVVGAAWPAPSARSGGTARRS